MIGPAEITRWAEGVFDDYLRSLLTGQVLFPLRRDRLGRVPAGHDLEAFHRAVEGLWEGSKNVRGFGYTVVLEEKIRRSRNVQNEPSAVVFETEDDYLAYLDRGADAHGFVEDSHLILSRIPGARPALMRTPRMVVNEHGHWPEILTVVEYLCANPRPGCYVRALPVPVQTKFIEAHEFAIGSLLAELPASGYDACGATFALRCGMLEDEALLRGRFLCPELQRQCGFPCSDITLPVGEWARIALPDTSRVVGCENKTNFLALPIIPNTLALWGGGGAAAGHFPRLAWLRNRRFIYWGDLDPCGLNILAQVRFAIPTVRSVLMDYETLRAHADHLVTANLPPGRINLELLRSGEAEAAKELIELQRGIEQERLLFQDCVRALLAEIESSWET